MHIIRKIKQDKHMIQYLIGLLHIILMRFHVSSAYLPFLNCSLLVSSLFFAFTTHSPSTDSALGDSALGGYRTEPAKDELGNHVFVDRVCIYCGVHFDIDINGVMILF